MKSILNKPYDLLEGKVFRYLYVFGGTAFAFLFLWIFEPYGLYSLLVPEKLLTIGLYTGVGGLLLFIQFFILQPYIIKHYTVFNTIVWILLSFLIIGTSSAIINAYLFNDGQLYLRWFFQFQLMIFSINITPVVLFVLIDYNIRLNQRLKVASNINHTLELKDASIAKGLPVVLNSENKKEGFSLELDSLLFICSLDNYIEVYFIRGDALEKRLLRYSLAGVEKDNAGIAELFRCHKSYIINKHKIVTVEGNAAGYKLTLSGYDNPIPVSRKWNKDLALITQ